MPEALSSSAFAELTGDTHPQHTDAEWARDSLFGEQIAHGLLVLSAAAGLVPFDPDRVVALRKVSDAVFKAPVKIGDTVHVVHAQRGPPVLPGTARLRVGVEHHVVDAALAQEVGRREAGLTGTDDDRVAH